MPQCVVVGNRTKVSLTITGHKPLIPWAGTMNEIGAEEHGSARRTGDSIMRRAILASGVNLTELWCNDDKIVEQWEIGAQRCGKKKVSNGGQRKRPRFDTARKEGSMAFLAAPPLRILGRSSSARYRPHDRTNKTGTSRATRKRDGPPLSERKGGQLAVTRCTCLNQLSSAAAAPLHRIARFSGFVFTNAPDAPPAGCVVACVAARSFAFNRTTGPFSARYSSRTSFVSFIRHLELGMPFIRCRPI